MRALVLCGGYGTRLGALTEATPKPLLQAGGRPLLAWILDHLEASGFDEILINLHFRGEDLRKAVGGRRGIHLVEEPQLLGTAGTVAQNAAWLSEKGPFLVHYGDVVQDGDLRRLVTLHQKHAASATLALHRRAGSNSHVEVGDDGRVETFVERPSEAQRAHLQEGLVFSGICLLDPGVITKIPPAPSDLPRDLFPGLAAEKALRGWELGGYRVAIDSPERLARLDTALLEGRCRPGSVSPSIQESPMNGPRGP